MPNIRYFLGANSPQGFYSLYDQLIKIEDAAAVYILKGGAGCGKSTLMRQVALAAEDENEQVEYILCSGDPDSLDAIVLPAQGVALVDGTAPHAAAPLGHFVAARVPSPLMVSKTTFIGQASKTTGITAQIKTTAYKL